MTDKKRTIRKPTKADNQKRFLEAYAETFGNITHACKITGISRECYYKWLRSNASADLRFREQLDAIEPKEMKVDFIESKFMELVRQGVPSAIIFGLKCLAKDRGYVERIEMTGADGAEMQMKVLKGVDIDKV